MAPLTGYDYFMQNALKYGWAVPQGVILMWSGSIATIPTGYVLCDGANDTPDLRDKFIVGAKQDVASVAKTNWLGVLDKERNAQGFPIHDHDLDGEVEGLTIPHDGMAAAPGAGQQIAANATLGGPLVGDTDTTDMWPPYYALAYIMKT